MSVVHVRLVWFEDVTEVLGVVYGTLTGLMDGSSFRTTYQPMYLLSDLSCHPHRYHRRPGYPIKITGW